MAKQVITIIIEDGQNEDKKDGVNCRLQIDAEYEAGSHSHLVALAFGEKFKSIMDVTTEYAQMQQQRKSRSAISLTRSIH